MDGITNVPKQQQQSQISSPEIQGGATSKVQQQTHELSSTEMSKKINDNAIEKENSINSKKDVESLVQNLNKALEPMRTNLQFGVDSQDVFYVSVTEANTGRMIRRFPAEQAQDFLPKMQEVSGIFLDTKG